MAVISPQCRCAPGCWRAVKCLEVRPEAMASHRTEQGLTAKLTANRSNSCHSLAPSADEYELSSCIDGWQRTALDRRGRVISRSSLVTPPAWARVWPADNEKRPVRCGQQR
jgi:hypothetical protein